MGNIDINKIIASTYNTIMEMQQAAVETVGTTCLWARATPVINSEDVVMQEYTLTNVGLECPKPLNVIIVNGDYNPGNYTIDLFGLNYDSPLELNITLADWKANFGEGTMPQKDDIVYFQIFHKLFEVKTSQVIYSLAAMPTYYKCTLSKYNPTSSRKETEEFRQSIEDLTVTQEDLFGDAISQEVADNNVTVETGYNTTTYVDPLKDFDIDCIDVLQIKGSQEKLITNAFYNFKNAIRNITYHTDLIYETSAERNHLIYSCWCKLKSENIKRGIIKSFVLFSKDNNYHYYRIGSTLKLNLGDIITITRGNLIKLSGTVVDLPCTEGFGIAISNSDIIKTNKKLTNWDKNPSLLKIYKTTIINLLKGYDENNKIIFDISYKMSDLLLLIGNVKKNLNVNLVFEDWHYFMFDISPKNIRIVISRLKKSEYNRLEDYLVIDNNIDINLKDFNIHEFTIENMGNDFQICNIRLYENEYEMKDLYIQDMYSPVTRNASKLILVDTPNIPNKNIFVSPIK